MPLRGLAVNCMIFLETRPSRPDYGTLLIALENGTIQVWSHHVAGGFITSFSANHKAGDNVICMITDKKNEYLFTGKLECVKRFQSQKKGFQGFWLCKIKS